MREKAVHVKLDAPFQVDTAAPAGDMSHTFNISTTVAFVVAGAGVAVAKHGNRSVSSKSGSADVLQALGINIEMPAQRIEECLNEVGIAFLFAPMMHQAMKVRIGPRREIGIRTIFTSWGRSRTGRGEGPDHGRLLRQPHRAACKGIGQPGPHSRLCGARHGRSGRDHRRRPTKVSEYKDGNVTDYFIHPSDFDLSMGKQDDLKGGDARENAAITLQVLKGQLGPAVTLCS